MMLLGVIVLAVGVCGVELWIYRRRNGVIRYELNALQCVTLTLTGKVVGVTEQLGEGGGPVADLYFSSAEVAAPELPGGARHVDAMPSDLAFMTCHLKYGGVVHEDFAEVLEDWAARDCVVVAEVHYLYGVSHDVKITGPEGNSVAFLGSPESASDIRFG